MATNTVNLILYKADPSTDGNNNFNVVTMLNDNWDKIDTYCKSLADALATHKLATSTDHDGRYYTEMELSDTTDNSSGADKIGASTIPGLPGSTVQALLKSLKAAVDTDAGNLTNHKSSSDHDSRYFTEAELKAVTSGASGANLIGASAIVGLPGSTVQTLLEALKNYVDATKQGLDLKGSVRVATTANLSATYTANVLTSTTAAALVIDGVTLAANDRVLVKDQTTAAQNGICTVTNAGSASEAWVLTRSTDADTNDKLTAGSYTFVEEGTTNADSGWVMTQNGVITLGTTPITWSQFSGAGQITANGGLTKTGNTISIASGGVTDTYTGNRTVNDSAAPAADTGTLTAILSGLAYMIKSITGKAGWKVAPAATLEASGTHIADDAAHKHTSNIVQSGSYANAEGANTTATGNTSHAEGDSTTARGIAAHAEGSNTTADGVGAHVEGYRNIAATSYAHAEGRYTLACEGTTYTITSYSGQVLTLDSTPDWTANDVIYVNLSGAAPLRITATSITANQVTVSGGTPTASWKYAVKATGIACAHTEGHITFAPGQAAHAEGYNAAALGAYSHAEGSTTSASATCAHAEGYNADAAGAYSHAEGSWTTTSATCSHAEGYKTTASIFAAHVMGQYNKALTGGTATAYSGTADAFVIGNGTASGAYGNALRVTFAGATYGLSAFNATGADYAEYFEWLDGNPAGEDRVGHFVTLEGDKIRYAVDGDYILGVTSATPSVIGDSYQDDWNGKYVTDKWGRIQYHDVEVPARSDDNNEIAPVHIEKQPIYNPSWDPNTDYIPREKRKEWAPVGMMGKLLILDNGSCTVNGFCRPGVDGIATASSSGYRVMKRIADDVVLVLIK